jgi:alkanesulfonate monooxygenase SsuD/methylene tetrahydromethanopterin reductase-like flavin-dependent oxidoreductase (luciferase family)
MKFGVFDHLDRGNIPLAEHYESRLEIISAYERAGFYGYHVAEHHFTPLGMAPSPNVFLAAVAQRTKTLRFGPMVYALPLYQPLRLLEEICMLDQMSRGRLELGFGRGSSPTEIEYYGIKPADAQKLYEEGLELIIEGLINKEPNFSGPNFTARGMTQEIEPLQRPHPPIWYGVHTKDGVDRAVKKKLNIVCNAAQEVAEELCNGARASWTAEHGHARTPSVGIARLIYVGQDDSSALDVARRAYRVWLRSFDHLWNKHKVAIRAGGVRPPEIDGMIKQGRAIVGSVETVSAVIREQLARTGADYFVGQFVFGDMSHTEALASIERFSAQVKPLFGNGSLAAE